jgi:hypothetical protein
VAASCLCGKENENGACIADTGTGSVPFFVNSTPTVEWERVDGPDEEGKVNLIIGYDFPNTLFPDPQRRLTLYRDGVTREEFFGSQVSGTWPTDVGTACLSQGSHELKVRAVACNHFEDPDYEVQAVTTVQVDHQPRVSIESVEPLNPANPQGTQVVKMRFNFPQTSSGSQRTLTLKRIPSGSTLDTILPANREGPWTKEVACSSPATSTGLQVLAVACPVVAPVEATDVAALPSCPRPPRKDDGCGKPGQACCLAGGAGPGGGGPGLGGKSGPPAEGPGARLRYLAGGVGSPGNPGQAAWNTLLGRGWSHDYAERVVQAGNRAWLLTREGGFREYTDANNDGFYEKVSPEDEYRILTRTATG